MRIENVQTIITDYFTPETKVTLVYNPELLKDTIDKRGLDFAAREFLIDYLETLDFYQKNGPERNTYLCNDGVKYTREN